MERDALQDRFFETKLPAARGVSSSRNGDYVPYSVRDSAIIDTMREQSAIIDARTSVHLSNILSVAL